MASSSPRRLTIKRTLVVAATIVILVGSYVIYLWNQIVDARVAIKASWAQVETTLQRRYDLIPNLVEIVKGYATHERELFTEIARLRSQWGAAGSAQTKKVIQPQMENSLTTIVALAEQYPSLRSSEQFMALQYQLEGTENRIAVARVRYNEFLRRYNALTQRFPGSLFGFTQDENYIEAQRETAPKAEF